MSDLDFHLVPTTPLGLIEISGVPEEFIGQIWLRSWPELHSASSSSFPWTPTTSNVRLFNDVVRAVLHDNAPLPELSAVASLVRDLFLFSLNVAPIEAPVEIESDSGVSNSGSEGEDSLEDTTGVGSRIPHSLQALQPVPSERHMLVPDDIATINLDGEYILFQASQMLETFHIVEDNGESHLLTENELENHIENPDSNVRDVEIRRATHARNTGTDDIYERLSRFPADDVIPYEHDLERIPDVPSWRRLHMRRLRRNEDLTNDYCHCTTYYGQSNNEDLNRPYFPGGADSELFSRRLRALEQSEGSGRYPRMSNRNLLGQREARFLAGLDIGDMDREITRRILQSPEEFGALAEAMSGYLMELHRDGDNYRLE